MFTELSCKHIAHSELYFKRLTPKPTFCVLAKKQKTSNNKQKLFKGSYDMTSFMNSQKKKKKKEKRKKSWI